MTMEFLFRKLQFGLEYFNESINFVDCVTTPAIYQALAMS